MDTFILIFGAFALAMVVFAGACAIFAAYTLNEAASYTKPFRDELEKAARELEESDRALGEAESARLAAAAGRPGPLQANDRSAETRQEGLGAPGRALLTRYPCPFCQRVRARLVNAWKAF